VAGGIPQQPVVLTRQVRVLQQLLVRHGCLHPLEIGAQAVDLAGRRVLRRLARQQSVEHLPAFQDRHRFGRGHDAHARPAVGDPLDQPLGDQHVQGEPGAVAGHAVPLPQLRLDQPLPRDDVAASDLVPQPLLGDAPGPHTAEQVCPLADHRSHRNTVEIMNGTTQEREPIRYGGVPHRRRDAKGRPVRGRAAPPHQ
jgi:hypothetical protein